jgi:PilZ domain
VRPPWNAGATLDIPFTAQAECLLDGTQVLASTKDIGSGGVLLKAEKPLRLGESIQVSIDWPVLLDERCPLRLVIFGKVVRSDDSGSAVGILRYEFRIRPKRVIPLSA